MTDGAQPKPALGRATTGPGVVTLAAKVTALRQTDTYPERPVRIETRQTHMSWLFFTQSFVYKLKKPLRYEFLDFSTLAARRRNADVEVRLNRRLAPNVYLGAVALTINTRGQMRLAGDGVPIEWLVKMRRLPAERMLDVLIQHGAVSAPDIDAIARTLSAFFHRCPAKPLSPVDYQARLEQAIAADCQALRRPAYRLNRAMIDRVHAAQQALLARRPTLLAARAEHGKIIEGHGDLRPEHICLVANGPVIFDCLEFNRQLRLLDPADELAFLALECERLGADFIEPRLFQTYTGCSGDRPPRALIHFYKTYRACLRAKLAEWHIHDLERTEHRRWRDRARGYLRLADRYRWRG